MKDIYRGIFREEQVVDRLSELIKIDLTAQEKDEMLEHLRSLIGYINRIENIDTDGVPVTERVSFGDAALREDTANVYGCRENMLKNSANIDGPYFCIPGSSMREGSQ